MATYVRAPEAARRLGVSTSTLYAYVSRGRIGRITAADGRASLFDVDEIEALGARSRRTPSAPPPTIDVLISSAVTQLSEDGLSYRGRPVESLIDEPFERVAELLWTGALPSPFTAWDVPGADVPRADVDHPDVVDLIELATFWARRPPDGGSVDVPHASTVARAVLASIPARFGVSATTGSLADRVIRIWRSEPEPELVDAANAAMVLLADHELATSTLAVRVAASVRSAPATALIAGLATVEGAMHGSASAFAHTLLVDVERRDARVVLDDLRRDRRRVPGFGHKIYRRRDPRFDLLLDRVRRLPDPHGRLDVVDSLLIEAGSAVAAQPNIDLALGALHYVAGLPADAPLFAIARIAGWTAHYLEELDERPVRYRGLARREHDPALGA